MRLKLDIDFGKKNNDMEQLKNLIEVLVQTYGLQCNWSIECDRPTPEQIQRTFDHLKLPHIADG